MGSFGRWTSEKLAFVDIFFWLYRCLLTTISTWHVIFNNSWLILHFLTLVFGVRQFVFQILQIWWQFNSLQQLLVRLLNILRFLHKFLWWITLNKIFLERLMLQKFTCSWSFGCFFVEAVLNEINKVTWVLFRDSWCRFVLYMLKQFFKISALEWRS